MTPADMRYLAALDRLREHIRGLAAAVDDMARLAASGEITNACEGAVEDTLAECRSTLKADCMQTPLVRELLQGDA